MKRNIAFDFFVERACLKARPCCYNFCLVYVRACVRPSIRIWLSNNLITSTVMHGFQQLLSHLKHFAGKQDIVVTVFVRCMCVRPCVRPDLSVQ